MAKKLYLIVRLNTVNFLFMAGQNKCIIWFVL